MEKPTVIIAGWLMVDPEKRDEYVKRHEDLVRRARSAPGCLDLSISADALDPGRVNMFELWQSEEDLESWRAVAVPPQDVAPILGGDVQKHEIHKSSPPF